MSTITIKCKRYDDVVLCDLPQTPDATGVLIRLVIHASDKVVATGKYQFAMMPAGYLDTLNDLVKEYLNPDVVKVEEV